MKNEPKFIIELFEYANDEYTILYWKVNNIEIGQNGCYSVEAAKTASFYILNDYATIFGLPEIKESQITYIGPKQIN